MYKAVYLICEVAECQSRPFFYYPFLRNESKRSIFNAVIFIWPIIIIGVLLKNIFECLIYDLFRISVLLNRK